MERIESQSRNNKLNTLEEISKQAKLQAFIQELSEGCQAISPERLKDILLEHALEIEDLKEFVKFNDDVYARNSIVKLPHIEVLVMCWRKGQLSPIHDHSGSACAVKVIQGVATEITYTKIPSGVVIPHHTDNYEAPEITSSFDEDIHQLGNIQKEGPDLVTLHCYSPPLHNMTLFPIKETIFCNYNYVFDAVSKRATLATKK